MWERIGGLSIRVKLVLPTTITLLIAAVSIFFYYPAQQKRLAVDTLEAKVLGMADVVSLAVAFGLARDMSAVAEAFRVAQRDPALSYIVVLDTADIQIGLYNPGRVILEWSDLSSRDGLFEQYGLLNVATPIRYLDRDYGTLGLGFNLESIETNVARSRAAVLSMGLALMIGGGALSVLLGNLVARPIIDLRDAAVEVSSGSFDVSVPVRSADEVGALAEAFNKMTGTLESTMMGRAKLERLATLGQLSATISHELRNPLGTIRTSLYSLTEYLRRGGGIGDVDRPLERIGRSVTRCEGIIADLLDYTRVRELDLTPEPVDQWLGDVLDEMTFPEGVTVHREFEAGAHINMDAERLRRAIVNTLDNAIQALSPDAPSRIGNTGRIDVRTTLEDGHVVVSVVDSGPGIADDVLDSVFDPLFTTKARGVGLGLSTVRQIVEQHGGTALLGNHPEGGASMTMRFPVGDRHSVTEP